MREAQQIVNEEDMMKQQELLDNIESNMKHQCKTKLTKCLSERKPHKANLELSALGITKDSRAIQSKYVDINESQIEEEESFISSSEGDVLENEMP